MEILLDAGVQKLKNFGFINVSRENILQDEVYIFYLKRFLHSELKKSFWQQELDELLKKIIQAQ